MSQSQPAPRRSTRVRRSGRGNQGGDGSQASPTEGSSPSTATPPPPTPTYPRRNRPPPAELPGLFPVHDGSYGVNTLLNIDAATKKGKKRTLPGARSAYPDEDEEDASFQRAIEAKSGKRFKPTSLQAQSAPPGTPGSDENRPPSVHSTDTAPPEDTQVPPWKGHAFGDQPETKRSPYKRVELPSPNLHALVNNRHPSAPPFEHIPFYGLPGGRGSSVPISPRRPDSSRSFRLERNLFGNAAVSRPDPYKGWNSGAPPPKPPNPSDKETQRENQQRENQQREKQQREKQQREEQQREKQQREKQQREKQQRENEQREDEQSEVEDEQVTDTTNKAGRRRRPKAPVRIRKKPQPFVAPKPPAPTTPKQPETPNKNTLRKISSFLAGLKTNYVDPMALAFWYYRSYLAWAAIFGLLVYGIFWLLGNREPSEDLDWLLSGITGFFSGVWSAGKSCVSYLVGMVVGVIGWVTSLFSSSSRPTNLRPAHINPESFVGTVKARLADKTFVEKDQNGELKITDDFWHAFAQALAEENSGLSRAGAKGTLSDDLWNDIQDRVAESGLIDRKLEEQVNHHWDDWLRRNAAAIDAGASGGTVVNKEVFADLLKAELKNHRKEINKDLELLKERVNGSLQQLAVLEQSLSHDHGLTQKQIKAVKSMIDAAVADAIRKETAKTVASGRINAVTSQILLNGVNFFGPGSGATIDPDLTSPPWVPPKKSIFSKEWRQRDGYTPRSRVESLTPWHEEGDCFCAGPDKHGFGQGTGNISVLLSQDVVPTNLAVEHMPQDTILDSGAMPRVIELLAYFEELNLRREVEAFSAMKFPDASPDMKHLNEGWVKIGEMTYDNKGAVAQIFPLDPMLRQMQAWSNHVLVRAVNNYGADHTCFYRLRLYGDAIERDE
ncbi:hypothetical protein F4780DRAFT_633786 [Xylariomycetidae sp. FL0641]|nr:hypothetical protein F4780DRAFT_633786 [Xylariomycetidae sp. FL0641]